MQEQQLDVLQHWLECAEIQQPITFRGFGSLSLTIESRKQALPFVERLKWMKVILAVPEKASEDEALPGKVPVFGLLKRGGKVYTQTVQDAKATTLLPIIQKKVIPDSIVYSDCWKGYNTLDVADFKHY